MRANLAYTFFALALMGLGLAACGNTWEGLKEDTSDNLESTGEEMQDLAD